MVMPTTAEGRQDLLQRCHSEATRKNGLIDFMKGVRGSKENKSNKYSVKERDIQRLFENTSWVNQRKPGGHIKWKHPVTHVVIEYSGHENDADSGAVAGLKRPIQYHLDVLAQKIFRAPWKENPDYVSSAERLARIKG